MISAKKISGFVKLEHTLFSLPLLFAGALLATGPGHIGKDEWIYLGLIVLAGTGARVLALALNRLVRGGVLKRFPLRDSVSAVSVGIIDGEIVLDLPYEEDARAEVDFNVVATGHGRFVEVQGTAEQGTYSTDDLTAMTSVALRGIAELNQIQEKILAEVEAEEQ